MTITNLPSANEVISPSPQQQEEVARTQPSNSSTWRNEFLKALNTNKKLRNVVSTGPDTYYAYTGNDSYNYKIAIDSTNYTATCYPLGGKWNNDYLLQRETAFVESCLKKCTSDKGRSTWSLLNGGSDIDWKVLWENEPKPNPIFYGNSRTMMIKIDLQHLKGKRLDIAGLGYDIGRWPGLVYPSEFEDFSDSELRNRITSEEWRRLDEEFAAVWNGNTKASDDTRYCINGCACIGFMCILPLFPYCWLRATETKRLRAIATLLAKVNKYVFRPRDMFMKLRVEFRIVVRTADEHTLEMVEPDYYFLIAVGQDEVRTLERQDILDWEGYDEIATGYCQRSLLDKDQEWGKVKEFELITEQIIEEDEEFNKRWPALPSVLVPEIGDCNGSSKTTTLSKNIQRRGRKVVCLYISGMFIFVVTGILIMLLAYPQHKEWESWVEVDGKVTSCDPFSAPPGAPPQCSFSIRFNATDGNEYGINWQPHCSYAECPGQGSTEPVLYNPKNPDDSMVVIRSMIVSPSSAKAIIVLGGVFLGVGVALLGCGVRTWIRAKRGVYRPR